MVPACGSTILGLVPSLDRSRSIDQLSRHIANNAPAANRTMDL